MLTHIRRGPCSILSTIPFITRKIQPTVTLEGASLELQPQYRAVRAIVEVRRERVALDLLLGAVVYVVLEVVAPGDRAELVPNSNAADLLRTCEQ